MYIKFLNSTDHIECFVIPDFPKKNIVTLKFAHNVVVNTSGFRVYLDKECTLDIGGDSYVGFNTIYRNDETTAKYNGYELSNDGTVWIKPVYTTIFEPDEGGTIDGNAEQTVENYQDLIIPTPLANENYIFDQWSPEIPKSGEIAKNQTFTALFAYVETLEEVQEAKVIEMNEAQQLVIQNGIDVQLTDGTIEHFTLTDHDQISLMGLQTRVLAGDEYIPWHTSDQSEECKYYSNADMALITAAAMGIVVYQVTYYRDLRIYIRALQTKEEVNNVTYGMSLPVEYQSQVLKDLLAQMT